MESKLILEDVVTSVNDVHVNDADWKKMGAPDGLRVMNKVYKVSINSARMRGTVGLSFLHRSTTADGTAVLVRPIMFDTLEKVKAIRYEIVCTDSKNKPVLNSRALSKYMNHRPVCDGQTVVVDHATVCLQLNDSKGSMICEESTLFNPTDTTNARMTTMTTTTTPTTMTTTTPTTMTTTVPTTMTTSKETASTTTNTPTSMVKREDINEIVIRVSGRCTVLAWKEDDHEDLFLEFATSESVTVSRPTFHLLDVSIKQKGSPSDMKESHRSVMRFPCTISKVFAAEGANVRLYGSVMSPVDFFGDARSGSSISLLGSKKRSEVRLGTVNLLSHRSIIVMDERVVWRMDMLKIFSSKSGRIHCKSDSSKWVFVVARGKGAVLFQGTAQFFIADVAQRSNVVGMGSISTMCQVTVVENSVLRWKTGDWANTTAVADGDSVIMVPAINQSSHMHAGRLFAFRKSRIYLTGSYPQSLRFSDADSSVTSNTVSFN